MTCIPREQRSRRIAGACGMALALAAAGCGRDRTIGELAPDCPATPASGPEGLSMLATGSFGPVLGAAGGYAYATHDGTLDPGGGPSYLVELQIPCGTRRQTWELGAFAVDAMAIGPDAIYVALSQNGQAVLQRLPFAGGISTLANVSSPIGGIAVDATDVFWTVPAKGLVEKAPIGGGSDIRLGTAEDAPTGLAADGPYLYWTNHADPGAVRRGPKDTPAAGVLVDGQANPGSVAVAPGGVLWLDEGKGGSPGTGALVRLPHDGGVPVSLAAGLSLPKRLAIGDTHAYWTDTRDGTVSRVPAFAPPGGAAEVVVPGPGAPAGIALVGDHIVWVDTAKQAIFTLPAAP